jgi:hypothetical protein
MAFDGVAPQNGWGAVGVWPGGRVVSIRAVPTDGTNVPFDNYQRAIDLCTKEAEPTRVVAVNLSLGCQCDPSSYERAVLDNRIVQAHSNGLNVVAAAGNNATVLASPASEPGVFSIGAADPIGALCSFSNHGAGLDLVAPGCDLDLADPSTGRPWSGYQGGTSASSMAASTALALLRSYRPNLGWEPAEHLLVSSARSPAAGPLLDLEALFRASDLGALVDAAKARVPPPPTAPDSPSSDIPSDSGAAALTTTEPKRRYSAWTDTSTRRSRRLPAPKLASLLRLGRELTVSVRNRPRGARVVLALQRRSAEFSYTTIARTTRPAHTLTLRLPGRWRGSRLVVRYDVPNRPDRTSPAIVRRLRG